MLAQFNEGEDEDVAAAFAKQRAPTSQSTASQAQLRAQQALSDPAVMRQLMQASHEAQQAKRQRLASLHQSANSSVGGLTSTGDEFGAHFLGTGGAARPRNYKSERAAQEREATDNP